MREDQIAGVAVAVVDRSGVVMAKGYGLAGVKPDRPADSQTLFRVGSISKTPVWISLMQLVEQGRIRLDDPVNAHLPPELRIPDAGYGGRPIRVRDLMTHSAGFEDSVLGGFFVRNPSELLATDAWLRTHRVHRVRGPGELAVYSNYGATLAGAVVAHVSGQPWPDYAEQHVLRPLGMATATYREPYSGALARSRGLPAPLPAAIAAHVSSGFELKAGALEPQPWEYVGALAPAGALSADAQDMAAYMSALLDPARLEAAGVLKASTFQTMLQPLLANTPGMGSWRHGFMDYSVTRGRAGAFGHGGDLIYDHATLEIYPQAGIGVFVAVSTPTGVPLRDRLAEALLARLAGPLPIPPPRAADAKVEAARVAGTYRSLRVASFRTERALMNLISTSEVRALPNGDILIPGGPHPFRAYPIGDGVFVAVDGPGRIAFRQVGGRMMRFDGFSIAPSVRIGLFQGIPWLGAMLAAGVVTAGWGVGSGLRRLFRRGERGRGAGLVLDGLCLLWAIAIALTAAGFAAMGDLDRVVFTYPGTLLPVGLWALAAAALATPVAAVLAVGPLRPRGQRGWSGWRWFREGAAIVVFGVLAVTLWSWGLLGYSGW
jgi:CubicO group peptidase (beta-lactamase class C family)